MFKPDQIFAVIDFETFSEVDLRKVGSFEYSMHPSTEVLCVSWMVGTREQLALKLKKKVKAKSWAPKREWNKHRHDIRNGKEFASLLKDSKIIICAHNSMFEQAITRNVLPRHLGKYLGKAPFLIPHNEFFCTAVQSATHAIPRSLDGATGALGLDHVKDKEGHRLMMRWCKPKKPSKADPSTRYTKDFDRLLKYCEHDIYAEVGLFISLDLPSKEERELWLFDQEINFRGAKVDRDLVQKVLKMITLEKKNMVKELQTITKGVVTSGGQGAVIQKWLKKKGVTLPNLQKKTVEDAIKAAKMSDDCKRVLELRQNLNKTSLKKYPNFLNHTTSDGVMRFSLNFRATVHGRWGGAGIQPHNFPRGTLKKKDVDGTEIDLAPIVAEQIKDGMNLEMIRLLYEDTMEVFVSCLRTMIIPREGKELFVSDFSAIEARVLFWLANHEDGCKAFREKRKMYEELAMVIFNRKSIIDVSKDERFVGKQAFLACFTKGTIVLTNNGYKKIIDVKDSDKLWDGVEWVNHCGLVDKGLREVTKWLGVGVTKDHLILTKEGWKSVETIQAESLSYQRLVKNMVNLKSLDLDLVKRMEFLQLEFLVHASLTKTIMFLNTIYKEVLQLDVMYVLKKQVTTLKSLFGSMNQSYQMVLIEQGCSTDSVQCNQDVILPHQKRIPITEQEGLKFLKNGEMIKKNFSNMLSPLKGGITQNLNLIGKMLIKGINLVTLDLFQKQTTQKIKDWSMVYLWRLLNLEKKLVSYKKQLRVYDLENAGPRNRYTILSSVGPIIVHNSGYGAGWKKFQTTCEMLGQPVTTEVAKKAINGYRELHAPVPKLWSNLEKAAIAAVEKPGRTFKVNNVEWFTEGKFLKCRLPSGRCLHYYGPQVRYEKTPWGESKAVLYHWTVDTTTKKWAFSKTWGGVLTQNCVGGISADLLALAMIRERKAGYDVTLTVHDEIVAERTSGEGNITEFNNLMEKIPVWAKGCPVACEGWSGSRYRK